MSMIIDNNGLCIVLFFKFFVFFRNESYVCQNVIFDFMYAIFCLKNIFFRNESYVCQEFVYWHTIIRNLAQDKFFYAIFFFQNLFLYAILFIKTEKHINVQIFFRFCIFTII